jgi:hypothetical protein
VSTVQLCSAAADNGVQCRIRVNSLKADNHHVGFFDLFLFYGLNLIGRKSGVREARQFAANFPQSEVLLIPPPLVGTLHAHSSTISLPGEEFLLSPFRRAFRVLYLLFIVYSPVI